MGWVRRVEFKVGFIGLSSGLVSSLLLRGGETEKDWLLKIDDWKEMARDPFAANVCLREGGGHGKC
jgi:hypothetical protein